MSYCSTQKNITISNAGGDDLIGVNNDDTFNNILAFDDGNGGTGPDSNDSITPATLDGIGATITLQANNDITITDAINLSTVSAGLTMQAGRSILINADISTNDGAVNILANQRTANGVVDAERLPGAAEITMADGTAISAGSADVTIIISDGQGLANNTSGDVTIENISTTGDVRIQNSGTTAGSDILRDTNATTASLITSNTVALEISNSSNATGTIGTSANNINLDTANLELITQGGSAFINEANALEIGGAALGGLNGINTNGGDLSITTGGALTDSESIIADNVAITSAGAILDVVTNNIGLIAASITGAGNSFSLDEADGFTVGSFDGVNGIVTDSVISPYLTLLEILLSVQISLLLVRRYRLVVE